MKKQNLLALLSLLVILIILLAIFSFLEILMEKPKEAIESPFSKLKPAEKFEEGLPTEKFHISGGEGIYPRFFKEVSFKPYAVATGDTQIFSLWVEDPVGVEKVKAERETDLGPQTVDLELIEGNPKEGLWRGTWHVCGYKDKDYYRIIFKAQSLEGKENTFTGFIKNKE